MKLFLSAVGIPAPWEVMNIEVPLASCFLASPSHLTCMRPPFHHRLKACPFFYTCVVRPLISFFLPGQTHYITTYCITTASSQYHLELICFIGESTPKSSNIGSSYLSIWSLRHTNKSITMIWNHMNSYSSRGEVCAENCSCYFQEHFDNPRRTEAVCSLWLSNFILRMRNAQAGQIYEIKIQVF